MRRTLVANDVASWLPRLAELSASQRANLRGVSKPRARQLVAGAVVAKAAMDALDVGRVTLCPWALREGIMLHYLQSSLDETWALPLQPVRPEEQPSSLASVHSLPEKKEA